MGVLNRNRYRIAERIEEMHRRSDIPRDHLQVVVDACRAAGLSHRVVQESGRRYVAVDPHPSMDFMMFTAVEGAKGREGGWSVWYRHANGTDRFRVANPIDDGVWCRTAAEAVMVAARWQQPQLGED